MDRPMTGKGLDLRELGRRVGAENAAVVREEIGDAWLDHARGQLHARVEAPGALANLGAAVADANVAASHQADLARVRNALLSPPSRRPAPIGWGFAWGAALAAAAAVLAFFVVSHQPAPLVASVGPDKLVAGAWIEASDAASHVAFSDGSSVQARKGTSIRVVELTEAGCDLDVVEGAVAVEVVPRPSNDWHVRAGPYAVAVLGTKFEVDWDREQRRLEVKLFRGKVSVTGPGLGERVLTPGQRLVVTPREIRVEIGPSKTVWAESTPTPSKPVLATKQTQTAPDPGGAAVASNKPRDVVAAQPNAAPPPAHQPAESVEMAKRKQRRRTKRARRRARTRRARTRATAAAAVTNAAQAQLQEAGNDDDGVDAEKGQAVHAPPWNELKTHRWCAAVEQGQRWGWARLADEKAERILAMADAARLCGRLELALQTYKTLRRRYPTDPEAERALFGMGRIGLAQGHHAYAARQFATYIARHPRGRFAEQARGRLLVCYAEQGDRGATCGAARAYMRHHRTGPRAAQAREIVKRCNATP